MIIQHKPNLILEALAYLGRRASNKTWDQMEQRIQQRKVLPSPALCQALERLKALTHQLDRVATAEEKEIQALFGNLEGFPYNTIGSSSPAFFLLYPLLDRFQGNWEAFSQLVDGLDREEVVWGIASIFEDDLPNQRRMDAQVFTDLVLGLNAPDSTKVALLELSRNHRAVGARALACLRPIVAHLEEHQAQLEELAAPYLQQCAPLSQLEFFTQLSHLRPAPETTYTLHPFLFGADTRPPARCASTEACCGGSSWSWSAAAPPPRTRCAKPTACWGTPPGLTFCAICGGAPPMCRSCPPASLSAATPSTTI